MAIPPGGTSGFCAAAKSNLQSAARDCGEIYKKMTRVKAFVAPLSQCGDPSHSALHGRMGAVVASAT
jgi:hypothetical protein